MSQKHSLEQFDLSGLPAALRQKIQEQLNRLPPEKQREFLEKAKPMLNRAMYAVKEADNTGDNLRAAFQKARMEPHGHYNQTIRPGDNASNTLLKWAIPVIIAAIVYTLFD
jgi:hypothetical protein